MILESIDDVMMLLTAKCSYCEEFRGDFNETYQTAKAKGDRAIISCKRGDTFEALKTFNTTEEDFIKLSKELLKALRDKPIIESFRESYNAKLKEEINKAHIYAAFANPEAKYNFNGFCQYCHNEVPMKVEKSKLWTKCSPCADQICSAD